MDLSDISTLLKFITALMVVQFGWFAYELMRMRKIVKLSLSESQTVMRDIQQEIRDLHNHLCPLEKRHWRK